MIFHLFRQDMGWFDGQQTGELHNHVIDGLEKVRLGLSDRIALSVQNLVTFFAGIMIG